MKKAVVIFCALAATVGCVMTLAPRAAEPEPIGPSPPSAICETIAEPEETTPPTPEIVFVEPVWPEETEVVATPEPEAVAVEETTPPTAPQEPTPTAPPQAAPQPTAEPSGGSIRTVDGQQQIYVPGFGWHEYNGNVSVCIEVDSDGDINKMVGSMG